MIIQIRGTSGSGKTWVIRQIIGDLRDWEKHCESGRRQPLYYLHKTQPWALLGHYESACGGCDNVGSAARVYEVIQLVQKKHPERVIICEGLLLSADSKWSLQLKNLQIVFLTTPLDTCLEQIRQRRKNVGNEKELKEDNTRKRVAAVERARIKLTNAGVTCRRASASQSVPIIQQWLKGTK